jgi:CheY-like chemotaxis protein
MLVTCGITPAVAMGPEEALRALDAEAFDLVLLDLQLPEIDGSDLATCIRRQRPQSAPKIGGLSLMGADDGRHSMHVDACLMKPFGISDLVRFVASLFADRSPAEPACTPAGEVAGNGGTGTTQSGLKVLLAEDNPVNQTVARRLLENAGHVVALACNGKEALDLWDQGRFDLILMDVQMPVMDGYTACAAIRRMEERRDGAPGGKPSRTPIVALTAHAMSEDRDRCLAAGMDGFLAKPIKVADFLETIANLASAPELVR